MIDKFRFHENVYMNKAEDPADGARGSSADENHKPSRDDERVRELNAASGKEAGSVRLHPLFDELSSYRMRTLLSTFSDDGSTGIRDFMDKWHTTLGSCLRSLGELERRPDNPAWSDELNQAMGETFEYMLETEPSTLMTEQRVETLVGDSVLCATMTNGKVEVRPIPGSEEEATITGLTKKGVAHPAGEQVSGPFGPVSSKLEIDIPLDSVNREGRVDLVEGQRVMFMILSAEKLNRMAALLEMPLTREFFPPVSVSPPPHDVAPNEPVISMEGAQKVIQKVLETLQDFDPNAPDSPEKRRAKWLQAALSSMVPTMEQRVEGGQNGLALSKIYDLGSDFATLRPGGVMGRQIVESLYDHDTGDGTLTYSVTKSSDGFYPLVIVEPELTHTK